MGVAQVNWPWKRPESPLEQKVDRVLSDTDQLLALAASSRQQEALINQKLDQIIDLLSPHDITSLALTVDKPVKQENK